VLGPGLAAFARDPTVELQLLTPGASATIEAVRTGKADLGVAAIDLVPRGIEARPLVTTPLCVALLALATALLGARWPSRRYERATWCSS